MGILEIINEVLVTMRIGGLVELVQSRPLQEQINVFTNVINAFEGDDFAFRRLNDPSSNRGTAFTATGPTTLSEQVELVRIAEKNQTTWPFAGI